MLIDFLNIVQAAHISFLPDGILDDLIEPTQRGERRLAGVDLQTTRLRAVAEALLAFAPMAFASWPACWSYASASFSLYLPDLASHVSAVRPNRSTPSIGIIRPFNTS
jgi:hypothetical protein